MHIIDGWLDAARPCPSPNFNQRPDGVLIDTLVLHNISLPVGEFANPYIEQLFCNTLDCRVHPSFSSLIGLRVSAHLLIRRNGEVVQFVGFGDRAWHAGVSTLHGRSNCNDFSIGIELEGCDDQAFTDAQYEQLKVIVPLLMTTYPALSVDRIVGHSDIAPGRKSDPGPCFDWQRMRSNLGG